jgi:ribonucleoside-diphosphate reductase alpha chain
VRAREVFGLIVEQAHFNGEPGVLFIDTANRSNPVPHLYDLEATNPCGEQWLGPYESCCLGSINLAQHCGPHGSIDWEGLRESIVLSTHFLDDVIEVNAFVPAVPQIREAAHSARRIGLGIMGLADLLYHMGVRYGSTEAQDLAGQVMEFIRYHSMVTSIELARQRGSFSVIKGSIYDPEDLNWEPPKALAPAGRDFGRPKIDWDHVVTGLREHGIRNAAQTTVAPTGTIATVAGCEGYGCEPVFALAYIRHVDDNGRDLRLTYTSPSFENALMAIGTDESDRESIVQQVMTMGSCQLVEQVPDELREVFVVSQDVSVEEHVRMQAALQSFVDNSMSKTINFSKDASHEDVAKAYMLAWELGCKGLTVYVTGSRKRVVLETKDTATGQSPVSSEVVQLPMWQEMRRPRPQRLEGCTYQINTPVGKAFVTINEKDGNQPFEVFITTAKAGSETAAVSEAIGRMISYALRVASPVPPRQRLGDVVRQLAGIGGGRPLGFGPNRVLSLPDGLAQALAAYLGNTPQNASQTTDPGDDQLSMRIGDLCAECGAPAVVNEEGCRKCYSCGFSEC